MTACRHCGGEIYFTHVNGICTPCHVGGGNCSGSTSTGYSYGTSMKERAAQLGHSLIFPTNCRHCSSLIYLYADEHGGFTIFDEVGPPWPLHSCSGWTASSEYHVPDGKPLSNKYKLPVPRDATTVDLKDGAFLRGTVVLVMQSRCIIFSTGQKLADVRPSIPVRIGQFVQGSLRKEGQEYCFDLNVSAMPCDDAPQAGTAIAAVSNSASQISFARSMYFPGRVLYWCILDEQLNVIEHFHMKKKYEAELRLQELRKSSCRDYILRQMKL